MTRNLKPYAQAVVNARELCGDERQALLDAQAEYGTLDGVERQVVRRMADGIWSRYQEKAGVTAPISPEERRQITRTLGAAR